MKLLTIGSKMGLIFYVTNLFAGKFHEEEGYKPTNPELKSFMMDQFGDEDPDYPEPLQINQEGLYLAFKEDIDRCLEWAFEYLGKKRRPPLTPLQKVVIGVDLAILDYVSDEYEISKDCIRRVIKYGQSW